MQPQQVLRPGMIVRDLQGNEIGTIEEVFGSPDQQDYRIVTSNGQVRIAPDLVSSIQGDEVHVNVSRDTIGSTTWGDTPADYSAVDSVQFQTRDLEAGDSLVVERHEEHLAVDKHLTQVGEVRVTKRVVEEPQTLKVDVSHDEYDVEQVQMERAWQPGDDAPRTEGDTIVVPIISEKVEVLRRRVVIGEVRLTKRQVTEQREITETVRREVVDVDGPEGLVHGQ